MHGVAWVLLCGHGWTPPRGALAYVVLEEDRELCSNRSVTILRKLLVSAKIAVSWPLWGAQCFIYVARPWKLVASMRAFASSNLESSYFWKAFSFGCFLVPRDLNTIGSFLLTRDHYSEHPLWLFSEMHMGSYLSHLTPRSLRLRQPAQTAVITNQGRPGAREGCVRPSVLWQVLVL